MAEIQGGARAAVFPEPGADTDAYVQKRRRLRLEATLSLHNKKEAAREPLVKYADVLARPELYPPQDVKVARDAVHATQVELSAERTLAALETLRDVVELKDTGDIQFESGVVGVSTAPRISKYLITHVGENLGAKSKTFMDWFPDFDLPEGLAITNPRDVKVVASMLHHRYMQHIGTLQHQYEKRMARSLRGRLDYELLNEEIARDKNISNLRLAAAGLYDISVSALHGTFSNRLKPTEPMLPLGDEYLVDPALEDVTYNIDNRSIWTHTYTTPGGTPVNLVVQSTTSRCRMPYNKYQQNEATTEFFNDVISPHTHKWLLITMRNPMHRFSIKIVPFHGLNTSMVFPFYAKEWVDPEPNPEKRKPIDPDFRRRRYDVVNSMVPYAIQGKAREIDAMYQAARVARFAGERRAPVDTSPEVMQQHFRAILGHKNMLQIYPGARVFYSKEDKHVGDTTVYFLYYQKYIFGVQIYAPSISTTLWKQYHKRIDLDHPDPWTMPPRPPNQRHPSYYEDYQPYEGHQGGGADQGSESEPGPGGSGSGAPQDPADSFDLPPEEVDAAPPAPEPAPAPAAGGAGQPPPAAGPREGPMTAAERAAAREARLRMGPPPPWPVAQDYQDKLGVKGTRVVPGGIIVENLSDSQGEKTVHFELWNPDDMIYKTEFYDLELRPFEPVKNQGWTWGIFKMDKNDLELGRKSVMDRVLAHGKKEEWAMEYDMEGEVQREPQDLTITVDPDKKWVVREATARVGQPRFSDWGGAPPGDRGDGWRGGQGPDWRRGDWPDRFRRPPPQRKKEDEPPAFKEGEGWFAWPITAEYKRALRAVDGELPTKLKVSKLPAKRGWADNLEFHLTDKTWMVYTNDQFNMQIRPYASGNSKGFNWGLYKMGQKIVYLGRKELRSNLLTSGGMEPWKFDNNIVGEPYKGVYSLQITVGGAWYPRTREDAVSTGSDEERRWNARQHQSSEFPLPLQPRRLAARPRPAPWASPSSVDMAGVLASLAEIKRALNAQGVGLRM